MYPSGPAVEVPVVTTVEVIITFRISSEIFFAALAHLTRGGEVSQINAAYFILPVPTPMSTSVNRFPSVLPSKLRYDGLHSDAIRAGCLSR